LFQECYIRRAIELTGSGKEAVISAIISKISVILSQPCWEEKNDAIKKSPAKTSKEEEKVQTRGDHNRHLSCRFFRGRFDSK
jgi:hypothetical protein